MGTSNFPSHTGYIRRMEASDVWKVVDVHLRSFPGFFLSFLGKSFLKELYSSLQSDTTGIAYVCDFDEKIAGFIAGTDTPSGFFKRLIRKRWFNFGLASLQPVLAHPSILPRLIRALRMPREAAEHDQGSLLMSIAVAPEYQGLGIGKQLVHAFLLEASRRGSRKVSLTTDRQNNDSTNYFYQSLGFECERFYVTPEGREMNEYQIRLN